jgi:hypothetical protein
MYGSLLVTEDRAAELIAVSLIRLRRMVKRGEVPARRLPSGEPRFSPRELREWAEQLPTIAVPASSKGGV